jgi:hypothetical protein
MTANEAARAAAEKIAVDLGDSHRGTVPLIERTLAPLLAERDARIAELETVVGYEPIESGPVQEGDKVYDGYARRWLEIPMLVGQPIRAGRYAVIRPIAREQRKT